MAKKWYRLKSKTCSSFEEKAQSTPSLKKLRTIAGAISHEINVYDGDTLPVVLIHIEDFRGEKPKEVVCDRGYRGKGEVEDVNITLPKTPLKRDNSYQRKCKRRAAIEPNIGHLESDYRLSRNYL